MRSKYIIMTNEIDKELRLPKKRLIKYTKYYKLIDIDNNQSDNICYILPFDTKIYNNIYQDKVIELKQVLENIYIINDRKNNKLKTLNKINKKQ